MVHDSYEANPKHKESTIHNLTIHTSKNAKCKGFKEEIVESIHDSTLL
jgi:hypothetical protein